MNYEKYFKAFSTGALSLFGVYMAATGNYWQSMVLFIWPFFWIGEFVFHIGKNVRFAKCSDSLYYDLVRIPHGHVPAPKVRFWRWLPLPIGGYRTEWTFGCPVCGRESFFKIDYMCRECDYDGYNPYSREYWERKSRREKWRKRWKTFEYVFLPLLVLVGKAYYLRSTRIHVSDYPRYNGNLTEEVLEEIEGKKRASMDKYGGYLP
jgi:ribosomal protein L37E